MPRQITPGRKPNRKGRSQEPRFVKFHEGVYTSNAWRSLDPVARSLLLEVWQRHNGRNNGQIPLSAREARAALGVHPRKIKKALADLEERGFLVCHYRGAFNVKEPRASEWEITTEGCDGRPPRALYRKWQANGETNANSGDHSGNRTVTTLATEQPSMGINSATR